MIAVVLVVVLLVLWMGYEIRHALPMPREYEG